MSYVRYGKWYDLTINASKPPANPQAITADLHLLLYHNVAGNQVITSTVGRTREFVEVGRTAIQLDFLAPRPNTNGSFPTHW
jgi:hypothetical protein